MAVQRNPQFVGAPDITPTPDFREGLRSMVIQLLNRHPIPRFGGTERDPVLSCAHIGEQKVSPR